MSERVVPVAGHGGGDLFPVTTCFVHLDEPAEEEALRRAAQTGALRRRSALGVEEDVPCSRITMYVFITVVGIAEQRGKPKELTL